MSIADQTKPPGSVTTVDSTDLLRGAKLIIIRHNGEEYRLLVTKNDKLILQK
ncbi:MAG: hemin uptake protein HemP [Planctomycetota bacterium]